MKIYTLVTFTDWANSLGCYGPLGMERLFDWLAVARIERVYWRAFNGGRANYPSAVAHVLRGEEMSTHWQTGRGGGPTSRRFFRHVDGTAWDELAEAVRKGHERGIEVCFWWSLCEEAHGMHVMSDWGRRRDIRMIDRTGNDYPGTCEFGIAEVRETKLAVLDELLARNPDGVLLDFVRHNATPSGDEQGVHRFGYNDVIRRAFADRHGADPRELPPDDERWLAYKNAYRARFVRAIRERMGRDLRLDAMTIPHVDNSRWLCLDLPALTGDGTFDLVVPTDMTHCNSPTTVRRMVHDLRRQVRGRAHVGASVQAYWGNLEADAYDTALAAAEEAGADVFMLYEGDHLIKYDLLTPTRAYHLGAARYARSILVARSARVPIPAEWEEARVHGGFYAYAFADRVAAGVRTSFQVLADRRNLYVKIVCHGEQGAPPSSLVREKKVFVDWIGARNYWQFSDSIHICLDPGCTRRRFFHFVGQRNGTQLQETHVDNHWSVRWRLEVECPSDTLWVASMTIPFVSLGERPRSGDRWGFQVYRTHQASGEVSSFFVGTSYGVNPREWGDIVFG